MAWVYNGAFLRGSTVRVILQEASNPAAVLTEELHYSRIAGQTNGQFAAMVQSEVHNWLAMRNANPPETDVTGQFTPP